MRFRDILKGTKFEKRMDRLFEDANMWLRDLGKNDIIHSENIENYLDMLVPDEMKHNEATFDKTEIFLLLYAVYLHDIGRGLTDNGHEKASYNEILTNYAKYGLQNEHEAKAVAEICYGHAKESERPINGIPSSYGIAGLCNRPVNLQFLAALLRLADETDHCYLRIPWFNTDKDSIRNLIRFVNFDTEKWIIEFQTEAKELDDLLKLQRIVCFTQSRLNEIKEVLESKGLLYYLVIIDLDHFAELLQLFELLEITHKRLDEYCSRDMINAFRKRSVEQAVITSLKNNEIILFIHEHYYLKTTRECIPEKLVELLDQVKQRLTELDEIKSEKLRAEKDENEKDNLYKIGSYIEGNIILIDAIIKEK